MRKIIVLGTLHLGKTPKDKLQAELEELKPDQLFVELPSEDSDKRKIVEGIADEMLFAYNWAKENNVPVVSYDIGGDSVLKDGAEEDEEYKKLSEEESKHSRTLSWEEIKSGNINNPAWIMIREKFIDEEIWHAREVQMIKNIQNALLEEGINVILTGAAHVGILKNSINCRHP